MPRNLFPCDRNTSAQDSSTLATNHKDVSNSTQDLLPVTKDHDMPNAEVVRSHPYAQTLGIPDIDDCVRLENATFPPQERCSREKFRYRFEACAELSLGLFTSVPECTTCPSPATSPVDSQDADRKAVLLAHIVSTKTTGKTVTDDDMALPDSVNPNPTQGHKEHGRTVCIHSLAVLPAVQRTGLGTALLKAYLERLRSSGIADHVALIAHDHLICYYERFGFTSQGPSQAQFGGGGWYDMLLTL